MERRYRIMLVDDERGVLNALRRVLTATPYRVGEVAAPFAVECHESPFAALERARGKAFDLFLADYRMPGLDGVGFLKTVRELQPGAVRMILSGYADLNGLIAAINEARIDRFLSKPWNDYELVCAVTQALAYRDLMLENQRLADDVRVQRGYLSPQERELRRLEEEEPGITQAEMRDLVTPGLPHDLWPGGLEFEPTQRCGAA